MVGISLIGPYVVVFFDHDSLVENYNFLSGYSQQNLILISSIILISIFLFRAISLWVIQRYILMISFERQVQLRRMIISSLIHQDYATRVSKTTAQYQNALFFVFSKFCSIIN